ncbi:MAG TPA: T9SS type A sorting domain-containing protein, partial [Bacteroidales bacterium]|nr:T9SS type A sorting domain-containing protein [Bacteroidales bacterium]
FVSAPTVVVSLGADKSICQGDTTQLNAVVSGGVPPYTYSWSPATSVNNATLPNPLAFPVVNTTYSVTVTDQNSDSGTDDIIVTVIPIPNVTFPNLPFVTEQTPAFPLTTGQPVGGTYSGPGVSGGIFTPSIAGPGSHFLTYTYTDPVSGCTGSAVASIWVDPIIPGIKENGKGVWISIYPNPSKGKVVLTVRTVDQEMRLEVLDAQGKVLMERNLINANGRHELDLSLLPTGIYHIRCYGSEDSFVQKLVIE